MDLSAKWLAILLLVAAIWGSTYPITKDTLAQVDVIAHLAIRFSIAAIAFGSYVALKGKKISALEASAGFLLGVVTFLSFTSQTAALSYTKATNGAFIINLYVILTPILSAIILQKMPSKKIFVASLVAVCGLYLLTGATSGTINIGDALAFLTAIGFSLHYIITDKYVKKCDVANLVFVQIAVAAVLILCFAYLANKIPSQIPPRALIELIYLGIFATIVTYFLKTAAQKVMDASRVSIIISTEVVFAAILANVMLGETLNTLQYAGAILIFVGVLIVQYKKIKF